MAVDAYQGIFVVAVFLGAIVQGFSGFAFSAVAGAILLQVQPPSDAIPVLMICSLLIQGYVLFRLRAVISLRESLPYIVAGSAGVILATLVFSHIDPRLFRQMFGVCLMIYAASIALRPRSALITDRDGSLSKTAVGFVGGFVGGLTAMPAVVLVMWGDIVGMPQLAQRAIIQPFIAAMQSVGLLSLWFTMPAATIDIVARLPLALPAMLAGAALGLFLFRKISEAGFRQIVSVLLFSSGVLLIVCDRS